MDEKRSACISPSLTGCALVHSNKSTNCSSASLHFERVLLTICDNTILVLINVAQGV